MGLTTDKIEELRVLCHKIAKSNDDVEENTLFESMKCFLSEQATEGE